MYTRTFTGQLIDSARSGSSLNTKPSTRARPGWNVNTNWSTSSRPGYGVNTSSSSSMPGLQRERETPDEVCGQSVNKLLDEARPS